MNVRRVGDVIKKRLRNNGYSLGLEFPYIYYKHGQSQWIVWHRHTGEVVYISPSENIYEAEKQASNECHRLNGLDPNHVDVAAIDSTP